MGKCLNRIKKICKKAERETIAQTFENRLQTSGKTNLTTKNRLQNQSR
jgi:hypothetical protein